MSSAHNTSAAVPADRAVLDRLREGFAVFDGGLRLVSCNEPFASLGGYPAELCAPGTPYAALARVDAARAADGGDIEAAVAERVAQLARREERSVDQPGAEGRTLSARLAPLPDGSMLLSLFDVTDRTAVEQQLRQDLEVLRVIADEAPVYLNLVDEKGALTYANRTALAFVGRTLDEIRGYGWELHHHPEDLPRNLAIFDEMYRLKQSHQVEFRIRRHDGEFRWMREIAAARFGPAGTFLGFVCSSEDITDAKVAQDEVARQREALHQSEKLSALGSLLASVAHELNNPLSVVSGQAQLLAETRSDARTAERAELI
jgi:PAS domain S-box-containing protein